MIALTLQCVVDKGIWHIDPKSTVNPAMISIAKPLKSKRLISNLQFRLYQASFSHALILIFNSWLPYSFKAKTDSALFQSGNFRIIFTTTKSDLQFAIKKDNKIKFKKKLLT